MDIENLPNFSAGVIKLLFRSSEMSLFMLHNFKQSITHCASIIETSATLVLGSISDSISGLSCSFILLAPDKIFWSISYATTSVSPLSTST